MVVMTGVMTMTTVMILYLHHLQYRNLQDCDNKDKQFMVGHSWKLQSFPIRRIMAICPRFPALQAAPEHGRIHSM